MLAALVYGLVAGGTQAIAEPEAAVRSSAAGSTLAPQQEHPLLLASTAPILHERCVEPTSSVQSVAFLEDAPDESEPPSLAGTALRERMLLLADVPSASELRVYLPKQDFANRGAGSLAFSVAGLDANSQRSVVGGRMQYTAAARDGDRLLSETRLLWLHEYLQSESGTTAFFSPGDRNVFAVQGLRYGNNWAILGTGFRWELADGWTAFTHYDAQANSQQVFYLGSGGVNFSW